MNGDAAATVDPGAYATAAAPFRVRERVRWSDVDAAGIVCYAAYLRFFELAETELFRELGLTTVGMLDEYGIWLVRRRVECEFHQPARLDDELDINAFVAATGRTSLELHFAIQRAGEREIAVEARYLLVAVDRASLRPVVVPAAIRRALERAEVDATSTLESIRSVSEPAACAHRRDGPKHNG